MQVVDFPLQLKRITTRVVKILKFQARVHAKHVILRQLDGAVHIQSIWIHSGPSEVPYSANQ